MWWCLVAERSLGNPGVVGGISTPREKKMKVGGGVFVKKIFENFLHFEHVSKKVVWVKNKFGAFLYTRGVSRQPGNPPGYVPAFPILSVIPITGCILPPMSIFF